MEFATKYTQLVQRHMGRPPGARDGYSEAAVAGCEARLETKLPEALRTYYRVAGRIDAINRFHNRLYTLEELHVADGYLWFMEENQVVVSWGLPVGRLKSADPIVFQIANVEGAEWYSEKMRLSTFLVRMFDWQRGFADPPA